MYRGTPIIAANLVDFAGELLDPCSVLPTRILTGRCNKGLLVALVGAIGLGLLFFTRTGGEPKYGGHRLGFWLQQLVRSNSQDATLPFVLSDEAVRAVRRAGTNALPTLLRMMPYPDRGLQGEVNSLLHDRRIPQKMGTLLYPMILSYRPDDAVLGFRALGPEARSAIPALLQMLQKHHDCMWAVMALCAIGDDGVRALSAEMPKIRDVQVRSEILLNLNNAIGLSQRKSFVPLLVERLENDPAEWSRFAVVQNLGNWKESSALSVAALTKALSDRAPEVRFAAADGLGNFGKEARSAVPALNAALNDSNPTVRASATNSLQAIREADNEKDVGR